MYIMVFTMIPEKKQEMRLIEKQIKREFRDCMPKRYLIFPTVPRVYSLSNSICIQMPGYGSEAYRMKLNLFRKTLDKKFVMDVQHDNGNITFILKNKK